jgi:lipopolysaccharide biosynthesis regulator YciM
MLEVLFFLLPIAALSGWWLGRRSKARRKEESSIVLPSSYLRGLNYLLNEQQDKAIDLFIQLLDVDNDTVETHLALGSLFRRRGEVDRAIRIHQNLIARPTLSKEQRMQALFELGQDYMRAGLLDRAETLFGELISNGPHTVAALQHLLDIYQQEKDWDKAIQIAQRLESRTGQSKRNLIAQYYCEKADNVYRHGEPSKALKLIKRALAEDINCARASIMEGDLEKSAGNYKAAIRAYHRVEQQEPDYLPEIIKSLTECYRAMGKVDEMVTFLRQNLAKHNAISIMLALAELIKQEKGENDAADFISEYLKQRPSVRGMDRLIELNLKNVKDSVRDKLQVLKDVTTRLIEEKPIYTCAQCGFTGRTLYWQCPSCKQWNTVKPIQGVEGE